MAASMEALAGVAFGLGEPRRAARIWGAIERLRAEIGAPIPLDERPNYDRTVAAARAATTDAGAFDAAWQEGRTMNLEQAVEYALGDDEA